MQQSIPVRTAQKPRLLRRVFITLLIIAVLWSGAWFAMAWMAEKRLAAILDQSTTNALTVNCVNRSIGGFPFSMQLLCDSMEVTSNEGDLSNPQVARAGAVSSGLSIFAPTQFVTQIASPFTASRAGPISEATWEAMTITGGLDLSQGLDNVNLTFKGLQTTISGIVAAAESGTFQLDSSDLVPESSGDLDTRADIQQATFSSLPPVNVKIRATLDDGYRNLVVERLPINALLQRGQSGRIDALQIDLADDGALAISGPLELDDKGRFSGKIAIGISEPEAVARWAARVDPQAEQAVRGIAQAVAGMGSDEDFDGEKMKSITVTLDKGTLRLGFIQLGKIPPLR